MPCLTVTLPFSGEEVSWIEGKVLGARYAREQDVPYLGLCLGLQCGVIEFARDVVGAADANSTEFLAAIA